MVRPRRCSLNSYPSWLLRLLRCSVNAVYRIRLLVLRRRPVGSVSWEHLPYSFTFNWYEEYVGSIHSTKVTVELAPGSPGRLPTRVTELVACNDRLLSDGDTP